MLGSEKLVVANQFITSKSRNKVAANKSWFTVPYVSITALQHADDIFTLIVVMIYFKTAGNIIFHLLCIDLF